MEDFPMAAPPVVRHDRIRYTAHIDVAIALIFNVIHAVLRKHSIFGRRIIQ